MTTNLKSTDVITAIEEKIALKKKLREAKREHDESATKKITKKINRGWAAAASEAHPTGPAAEAAKQVAARFAE